ncbi:MAG: DUF2809 domain-containing protein [Symploca sp. SIO2D2]|nr:DUF2809 domain-containing protein [Symploca sp. SIO2D2]
MTFRTKQRLIILLSLLIITPLGFFSKSYDGLFHRWVNDYSGDILYEIFWCLFVFLLIPTPKAVNRIPLWVFGITCILEVIQLWQHPVLAEIRTTWIGKIFLGTTFAWWDFPHYFLGCILGWLWLRQISTGFRKKPIT